MKRIIVMLYIIGFISHTYAQQKGKSQNIDISAPSLANALVKESEQKRIFVYLPPTYYTDTLKRYPVVYFLSGFSGNNQGFMFMDELIGTGKMKEMIIVSANGLSVMVGSFYTNSPVTGNWDDFITKDVVNYVDANFRTIKKSSARGIGGHSMGGFGALNLPMLHPDVFCIGYGISPGLFDEKGLRESQILIPVTKSAYFSFLNTVKGLTKAQAHAKYLTYLKTMQSNEDVTFSMAYGSAFSSDTALLAPYLKYPFSSSNSNTISDSTYFKNYDNGFGNLKEKTVLYKSNFQQLKGYAIDFGTNDEYKWIPKGCVYFDKVLTEAGIDHEFRPFNGSHNSDLGTRIIDYMLPYCNARLEFDTLNLNTATDIVGIKIPNMIGSAQFDTLTNTISVEIDANSDLTNITPTIYLSPGASITPKSGSKTDFSSGSLNYTVISERGADTAIWKINVKKQITSVNKTNTKNFTIYPNPGSSKMNIEFSDARVLMSIVDITGKTILKKELVSSKETVDITELARGIYFIKASGEYTNEILKYIVK